MSRNWRWEQRALAALAVVGVLLAPLGTVMHAQGDAARSMPAMAMSMPLATHAAGPVGHQLPGQPPQHHGAMPCCDFCFGGCSCATVPIALGASFPVLIPVAGTIVTTAPAPHLLPTRRAPHTTPFALPPPGTAAS
jgi:hypothetical protein